MMSSLHHPHVYTSLSPCAIKSLMQKELSSLMGLELISLLIPEEEHSKGRNVVAPWVFTCMYMYVAVYD